MRTEFPDQVLPDGLSELNWTPPTPREIAAVVWDLLRHQAPASDLELLEAVARATREGLPFNGPARRRWSLVRAVQVGAATTSDGQAAVLGLARWAQNGFPVVTMHPTYAAALLATSAEAPSHLSLLSELPSPFPGFVIDVAESLLPVDNPAGPDFVTRVLVFRHEHRKHPQGAWAYVAWTKLLLTLWRFGVGPEGLLPPELESTPIVHEMASFPVGITDADRRTKMLIGRLIVNTCLAMTDPANVQRKGTVHRVGRRLDLDLREEVRAFGQGAARRSPEGGWVSSHWKMQPYGPGRTLRKWIFVEPYWRGANVQQRGG